MKLTRRSMLAAPAAVAGQAPDRRPNLLFVLSDDHSYPFLGTYGSEFMRTPNLDRMAAEGMLFERAFTAAPQCVPSRTAMMTGRAPVAARMGRFSSPLPADVVTAPEVLREAGYYTGVSGRYFHLDGVIKPNDVTARVYEKHGMKTWSRRVDMVDTGGQGQTTARFAQFLDKAPKERPWFFWINYSDPHHVWDRAAGAVDPQKVRVPAHLPDLPGVRDDLARYCGEVERLDTLFGQQMELLRSKGLEQNTLVVFMGDDGMAFPHGKGSLYDPGLNVPLIASWPGRIKPGRTRTLISGEDIAPTFIEAGGGKTRKEMTGRSFLGLLTGAGYTPNKHIFGARLPHGNANYTETTRSSTFDLSRCVRSDGWKLIYNCTPHMEYSPVDSARDAGWLEMVEAHRAGRLKPEFETAYFKSPRPVMELYDLEKDPAEMVNLAGRPEHAAVQAELTAALQEKMIVDFDFLPPPMAG